MTLPENLFIADSDGALYDTRDPDWSRQPPLRRNYSRGHRDIHTAADLKAALRNGGYAWPGGYPLYFITVDGAALPFETVRQQFRTIAWAIRNNDRTGWRVVACAVNWEDGDLYDDHTGERIEFAYAGD